MKGKDDVTHARRLSGFFTNRHTMYAMNKKKVSQIAQERTVFNGESNKMGYQVTPFKREKRYIKHSFRTVVNV